jgi:hypothetical protein
MAVHAALIGVATLETIEWSLGVVAARLTFLVRIEALRDRIGQIPHKRDLRSGTVWLNDYKSLFSGTVDFQLRSILGEILLSARGCVCQCGLID